MQEVLTELKTLVGGLRLLYQLTLFVCVSRAKNLICFVAFFRQLALSGCTHPRPTLVLTRFLNTELGLYRTPLSSWIQILQ